MIFISEWLLMSKPEERRDDNLCLAAPRRDFRPPGDLERERDGDGIFFLLSLLFGVEVG